MKDFVTRFFKSLNWCFLFRLTRYTFVFFFRPLSVIELTSLLVYWKMKTGMYCAEYFIKRVSSQEKNLSKHSGQSKGFYKVDTDLIA